MPTEAESTARIRLRAWPVDDIRTISALAHENQGSAFRRRGVVERRAVAAGWPAEKNTMNAQRAAAKVAYRRRRAEARLPEEPT